MAKAETLKVHKFQIFIAWGEVFSKSLISITVGINICLYEHRAENILIISSNILEKSARRIVYKH
jgi:hypothetical protein